MVKSVFMGITMPEYVLVTPLVESKGLLKSIKYSILTGGVTWQLLQPIQNTSRLKKLLN